MADITPHAVVVRMNHLTDPELVESGQIRHGVYVWSTYEDEYLFTCWCLDAYIARQIAEALSSDEARRD